MFKISEELKGKLEIALNDLNEGESLEIEMSKDGELEIFKIVRTTESEY